MQSVKTMKKWKRLVGVQSEISRLSLFVSTFLQRLAKAFYILQS